MAYSFAIIGVFRVEISAKDAMVRAKEGFRWREDPK
jgi:hypothetical protein